MDFEALLKLLELESAGDFAYFEQFAELVETEEEITQDALLRLVSEADPEVLTEIINSYFEETLKFVPEEADELFTLLQTIGTTLASLAAGADDEENARGFSEEFLKFKSWFAEDAIVRRTNEETEEADEISLLEALSRIRLEHIDGGDFEYDFDGALDYPMDEYIVSLASLARAEDGEEELREDSFDDNEDEEL